MPTSLHLTAGNNPSAELQKKLAQAKAQLKIARAELAQAQLKTAQAKAQPLKLTAQAKAQPLKLTLSPQLTSDLTRRTRKDQKDSTQSQKGGG